MQTVSPDRIAAKVRQMDGFACSCRAIAEPHTKRDCGPMCHAMSWHGRTVVAVATVAEAREYGEWPCPCLTVNAS